MIEVFISLAKTSPPTNISLISIVRSLVAVHIGRWNTVKGIWQRRNAGGLLRDGRIVSASLWKKSMLKQIASTRTVLHLLTVLNLLPYPLSSIGVIFDHITPSDISGSIHNTTHSHPAPTLYYLPPLLLNSDLNMRVAGHQGLHEYSGIPPFHSP